MCKYFGYFLSVWALGLGTFYAYMLYDIINSIRSLSGNLAGPLGAFSALLGPSTPSLGGSQEPAPPINDYKLDAQTAAIHELINKNMADVKKREQYLREFLPDVGLEDKHFDEMNALLEDFKFDKLKDYIKDLEKYMQENIKDAEVRKKALAKLQEFDNNTEDIDESINRLAAHILGDEL